MKNSEFLYWLMMRLTHRYDESPNTDFVLRLGRIVDEEKLREAEEKAGQPPVVVRG